MGKEKQGHEKGRKGNSAWTRTSHFKFEKKIISFLKWKRGHKIEGWI